MQLFTIFASDLELLEEVRVVLMGPLDVDADRQHVAARALASLESDRRERPTVR